MRCPKCGYNSFDHLESCKKCGKDLTEHKAKFGVKSILLTGVSFAAEGPEESIDIDIPVTPEQAETSAPPIEPPVAESDDLSFDFMGDSEEEETLPFNELFEDTSLEDDVDESLPAPKAAEATDIALGDGLDDPSAFDFEAPEDLDSDLGLGDSESHEEDKSIDTDLGLDSETDNLNLYDETFESKEDSKRPFDCEEVLQTEELPTPEAEELPPLPDNALEDQPLESLETAFGEGALDRSAAGVSDAFSLGALPTVQPSDSKTGEEAETPRETAWGKDPDEAELEMAVETDRPAPPFGRRVSAFLCDIILLGLVGFCFIIVAEIALSEKPAGMLPSLSTLIDLSIPYFLVIFCLTFGYFTLFHFLAGQTPGKMVTGIQVETIDGESLAFSQAFMRSIGGLIQILPVGLGYLTVLLHREGRGWNDRLAGTRLVDLKNLQDEGDYGSEVDYLEESEPDEPEES